MPNENDPIDKLDELFGPKADPDNPEAIRFAADLKIEWDARQLEERRRGDRRDESPRR